MQDDAAAVQIDIIPGEYRDRASFEMFHGLLLREDGTFEWAISVGAMDRRSSGTWEQHDGYALLTTSPVPTAPEFVRQENDPAQDAPFLLVSWANGNGIPGIEFTLSCEDGKQISHYTQYDGWRLVPGECDAPVSITLTESVHDIGPAYFQLEGQTEALRFTLVPNDFGVEDLTGATMLPTEDGLELSVLGGTAHMVRTGPAPQPR